MLLLDDVVAQDDADLLPVGEMFGQRQRVGDAALAFLVGVVDVRQAELFAIRQQAQKIAGILAAGDDQNIADARIHQRLDRVVDHRLVVDRQQMFVGDLGQREQPAACSSGQDDTFHKLSSYQMDFGGPIFFEVRCAPQSLRWRLQPHRITWIHQHGRKMAGTQRLWNLAAFEIAVKG